jgi:lipoyl(octanoyl) transferase
MRCSVEQLGTVPYAEGLRLQREKTAARKAGVIPDTLLLLEHPHVITLGRNARRENLLASPERLAALGIELFETDRGGDVTYHGPGQWVGYPILDLARHRRDVSWYMRSLEEVLIRVAGDFGVRAGRLEGEPGVWVGNSKLAAMGVHLSRWVTSHGFALNVNTDLDYFRWIVPCGLATKGVTSLAALRGEPLEMGEVAERLSRHFGSVFGLVMEEVERSKVESRE